VGVYGGGAVRFPSTTVTVDASVCALGGAWNFCLVGVGIGPGCNGTIARAFGSTTPFSCLGVNFAESDGVTMIAGPIAGGDTSGSVGVFGADARSGKGSQESVSGPLAEPHA
jgi:hypothetical protein